MHSRQPVIFVSHGSPTFVLEDNRTVQFWRSLPELLPEQPKMILAISAHWEHNRLSLCGGGAEPRIQHDFFGFPLELYEEKWELPDSTAAGDWLLDRLHSLLLEDIEHEPNRPLDHGVWVPGKVMWPRLAMPVLQLSLVKMLPPSVYVDIGRRLQELRNDGVLILGSGGITHNLGRVAFSNVAAVPEAWATTFVEAVESLLAARDYEGLARPLSLPYGRECHSTLEHFLPLLLVAGAAGSETMRPLHRAWAYGSLGLHAYGTIDSKV